MHGTDITDAPADKRAPKPPTSYQLAILRGIQDKPVYQGTTPEHVRARRRQANRAARKSRRINRKGQ